MIEIYKNIYVGDENSYYSIFDKEDWAILHCCKHPFHCQFVGYSGNLPSTHEDYALKRKGNEMALNLVDMHFFSENYLDFNKDMFEQAFSFLDEYYKNGKRIYIHCNEGKSRSPSLGMLYMARLGGFDYADFENSLEKFKKIYPTYEPKKNIFETVKRLWDYFVKE